MKKKIVTLALSMVLCLSMGMTALAAPSPSAGPSNGPGASNVTPGTGNSPSSSKGSSMQAEVKDANGKVIATVSADAKAKALSGYTGTLDQQVTQIANKLNIAGSAVAYTDVLEVTKDNADAQNNVTFGINAAKKGESGWYVLHYANNSAWEAIAAQVTDDGKVVAKFTSFSPAVVIKVAATAAGGPGAAAGSSSTAAPKTGDFATPIAAEVVALMSIAGIALYVKKSAAR